MKKILLKYPVSHQGAEYAELNMRRPKTRDMVASEKVGTSQADHEVGLIANLCQVSPDVILELDWSDYTQAQEALKGFTG